MSDWTKLEAERTRRLAEWKDRDGFTPAQRCAILIVVRGNGGELMLVAAKQTLRVLHREGMVDDKCRATRKAEQLIAKWLKEDRQ